LRPTLLQADGRSVVGTRVRRPTAIAQCSKALTPGQAHALLRRERLGIGHEPIVALRRAGGSWP